MKKTNNFGFAHVWLVLGSIVILCLIVGIGVRINKTSNSSTEIAAASNEATYQDDTNNTSKDKATQSPDNTSTDPSSSKSDSTDPERTPENVKKYAACYDAITRSGPNYTFVRAGEPKISSSVTPGYKLARVTIYGPGSAYFYSIDGGTTWVFNGITSNEWECSEFDTAESRAAYKGTQCYDAANQESTTVQ